MKCKGCAAKDAEIERLTLKAARIRRDVMQEMADVFCIKMFLDEQHAQRSGLKQLRARVDRLERLERPDGESPNCWA